MKTEEQFYTKLAEKHAKQASRALEIERRKQKIAKKTAKAASKIMSSVQSKVNRLASKVVEKSKKIEEEDWTDFEKEIEG